MTYISFIRVLGCIDTRTAQANPRKSLERVGGRSGESSKRNGNIHYIKEGIKPENKKYKPQV